METNPFAFSLQNFDCRFTFVTYYEKYDMEICRSQKTNDVSFWIKYIDFYKLETNICNMEYNGTDKH